MRPTLKQIKSATSSLIDCGKYNISFGAIPGSGLIESKQVCLECYSITLPSETIETIDVNIRGHHIHHRGLVKQDKTFSANFYNNGSGWEGFFDAIGIPMNSYRVFNDWMKLVADIETQNSSPKSLLPTSLNSYVSGTTGKIISNVTDNIGDSLGISSDLLSVKTTKKNLYTCPECQVDIYNQANILQNRFIFKNVFPTSIKVPSLGDCKNMLTTEVAFNFDYFYCTDVLSTKALSAVDIAERKIAMLTGLA